MNCTTVVQLPTIALIDPDLQSYQTVQHALAERFHFLAATTAEGALRMASSQPIALWLIAACLPEMSGAEFCRLLRQRDPQAPIVVVGDADGSDEEVACRMAGVTGFFNKPVDPHVFTAFVDQVARSARRMARRRYAGPFKSLVNGQRWI